MGEMIKLGLVLMLVALVAAVALGLVNSSTAPIIAVQQEMAKQEAMSLVALNLAPAGDSLAFDSIAVDDLDNPYASADEALRIVRVVTPDRPGGIGYVFVAYGKGYSSTIQTMVAVDNDGIVQGTTILYQSETPGLGANVVQPGKLIGHITGLDGPDCLLSKDGGSIDTMTGCTITSRAVVNSVRDGIEAMQEAGLFSGSMTPPADWEPEPPPSPPDPISDEEPGDGVPPGESSVEEGNDLEGGAE